MITPWGYVGVIASLIFLSFPTILIFSASIIVFVDAIKEKSKREIKDAIWFFIMALTFLLLNIYVIVIFVVYH